MSKKKAIPHFESEEQEQEFWDEHDSTEYVDWSQARPVVLANLQPSTKTISLRLPEHMLEELKLLANKRDVPYQSLLKVFLAERIQAELQRMRGTTGSRRQGPDLTY
jgi:predicted DNA binding CopG/RHH family protein